jgi:hypothetical protein
MSKSLKNINLQESKDSLETLCKTLIKIIKRVKWK